MRPTLTRNGPRSKEQQKTTLSAAAFCKGVGHIYVRKRHHSAAKTGGPVSGSPTLTIYSELIKYYYYYYYY